MLEKFTNNVEKEDEFNHKTTKTLIENIEYLVYVRHGSFSKSILDQTNQSHNPNLSNNVYINSEYIEKWLESNPIKIDES